MSVCCSAVEVVDSCYVQLISAVAVSKRQKMQRLGDLWYSSEFIRSSRFSIADNLTKRPRIHGRPSDFIVRVLRTHDRP